MNRLIIDDIRVFADDARYSQTLYARDLETARFLIESGHWDEVWLDFDMGEGQDTPSFAQDLTNGVLDASIDLIFVHTSNPVGKEYLYDTLRPYYATVKVTMTELRMMLKYA